MWTNWSWSVFVYCFFFFFFVPFFFPLLFLFDSSLLPPMLHCHFVILEGVNESKDLFLAFFFFFFLFVFFSSSSGCVEMICTLNGSP